MDLFGHEEELKSLREQLWQCKQENHLIRIELKLAHLETRRLLQIIDNLTARPARKLSYIKIAIGGKMPVGPATLTVGDKKTATVQGFDQNGAPFPIDFTANPVTWADDNEAAVQDAPAPDGSDPLTAVAAGVMNLTATVAGLTDTEVVTVVAQLPKLSAVKISID